MTKLKNKNRLANLINDLQYDGLDGDGEDEHDGLWIHVS
jgi:hypothetical protein